MASNSDKYYQISLDGEDSQRFGSARISKVGATLTGGACLLLLSMVALSAPTSRLQSTFAADTTNLAVMPASLGTRSMTGIGAAFPRLPVPGVPVPLQKLAIEMINANNRCERDVSVKAFRSGVGNLDRKSVTVLAEAAADASSKLKTMPGIVPPLGFFDPWGLSANAGGDTIGFFREAELKHGRICMLAFAGYIVGETLHPFTGGGEVGIMGVPIEQTGLTSFFSSIIAAMVGFNELQAAGRIAKVVDEDPSVVPGDLGWDPLGLKPKGEKEYLEIQNKELLNGRLAMIAIAGAVAQEAVTGTKILR